MTDELFQRPLPRHRRCREGRLRYSAGQSQNLGSLPPQPLDQREVNGVSVGARVFVTMSMLVHRDIIESWRTSVERIIRGIVRSRLFFLSVLCTGVAAVSAAGQAGGSLNNEPRLPAPAADLSPVEDLIRRGRARADAGRHRESAEVWQQVGAAEPVLSTFARRETIRAQLGAGELQGALAGLAELGGAAPADLLLGAAATARASGSLVRSAALYRQARSAAGRTSIADQAAIGLAAALEQDGKPREALGVFRELQLTFRQASAYDIADAGARRLSAELGGVEPLTEQDYDSIVDRLAGVAAFRRAVDMLAEWKANFPATLRRRQIDAAIVERLYSLRANDEARAQAEWFLKEYPDSTEAHNVAITLFRLDAREGKSLDVERRGRAIIAGQVQGTSLGDRQGAARLLAEYLVSSGQPLRGLGVYDQLYGMIKARTERIDVLWRMAIASLRAGNRTRAMSELKQVLSLRPDSETERASIYWLAYAEDASGLRTAARTHWAALASRFPYSYYGARASEKLGAGLPEPSLSFPPLMLRDVVVAHPDFKAAALLARAGLLSDAAVYARRLNSAFRQDDAVALLAARASEDAGDHSSASTLMSTYFGRYLERPATGLPDDFWSLAYPLAYRAEVEAAASRHNVDPLLMMALARQESHFDRTARSPVGAIGLFQIMPYTAAELDPAFAVSGATERLVESAVSAELAASLLQRLSARYDGAIAPTIASYNADKDRVQVWWDASRGLPDDLFIDSIPYRETRGYVRQVLSNYAMYQRIAAQSASPQK
jgi:soluble lytic murein transglycosylase